MAKDFFISYNHNDKAWAEWIGWHLEEAGHSVVLQEWDFVGGGNFVAKINAASINCDRTFAILSPDYLASGFCTAEWTAAVHADPDGTKGKLCAALVRTCELPGLLGPIARIDLTCVTDKAEAVRQLLDYVRQKRRKPDVEPPLPLTARVITSQPRFPGALPPVWNLPHPRNPNFTGREDLLAQTHASLASGTPAALTQALAGLGGIGKTQLANEYAYRHAGDYEAVWWIRSEEPTQLASDYANLAAALGLPEKDEQDQRIIVAAVRGWLEHHRQWLLVFDNVPHPDAVTDYLPRGGAGQVLITSRDQNWGEVATRVTVPKLPRPESIAFLEKRLDRPDPLAHQLADELGDFPLALAQAAAYIETTQASVAAYLDLYRTRRQELWQDEPAPAGYEQTVATTWSVAMTNLQKECPAALDLLRLCAYLAPDDIPISMVREQAEKLPEPLAAVAADRLALNRSVVALRRYSLVEVRGDSLSVHRLVQAVVRDGLNDDERRKWIEAAVSAAAAAFPEESDDVRTWPVCLELLPHTLAAADWAQTAGIAQGAAGYVLNQAGLYLKGRALFADAKSTYERARAFHQQAYGPEHPEVAAIVNNLGEVLRVLGDLEGAKAHFERALVTLEKAYGPDHPDVAVTVSNLGSVLQPLGDLQGAKAHFERALAIAGKARGRDHPEVALYANNLGGVLWDLGDLEGAKAHFERALVIDERAYGPDHPNVAIRVNNLGLVLQDLGDLQGAKAHFERALAIDEKAYGPDHPEVAIRAHNIGVVHIPLGDIAGARGLLTRALRVFERLLGNDHPNTINARRWLDSLPPAEGKAEAKAQGKGKRKKARG